MMTPPDSNPSPLSLAEEQAILTVTCLAAFLYFNSFGSIAVALPAMLSSFGTAAGTIGTTIALALMELGGGKRLWSNGAAFADAQQFAFACLVPMGLVAVTIALMSRRGVGAIIKSDQ